MNEEEIKREALRRIAAENDKGLLERVGDRFMKHEPLIDDSNVLAEKAANAVDMPVPMGSLKDIGKKVIPTITEEIIPKAKQLVQNTIVPGAKELLENLLSKMNYAKKFEEPAKNFGKVILKDGAEGAENAVISDARKKMLREGAFQDLTDRVKDQTLSEADALSRGKLLKENEDRFAKTGAIGTILDKLKRGL